MNTRAVVLTVSLTATASVAAQFRSSVSTVAVYATVAESDGRLITDLERSDFTLLDNGAEVPIALFSNDPQPITVALMLDMSGSMVRRFAKVRESTLWFINALAPGDRVQIGSFGEEVAISPLLTGDKRILTRVIDEELWPLGSTPLWNAADLAMDAAACIGCGACVAACKNASAMLFVSAKVSQLGLLPQGQPERDTRVLNMSRRWMSSASATAPTNTSAPLPARSSSRTTSLRA